MNWFLGIDIGSVNSKGVLLKDKRIIVYKIIPSETNYSEAAEKIRKYLFSKAGINNKYAVNTLATGFGAESVKFSDMNSAEIICSARGVNHFYPQSRTIIDVGGRSSKAIRIDSQGRVLNFAASEKCAVGSGRFLQVIANVLRINLEDFGQLALNAKNPVKFSTACAVFGESEAITRVAEGIPKEDILAGVHHALGNKIGSLVEKVSLEKLCVFIGGGAKDIGLIKVVEEKIGARIFVFDPPQIATALGAALVAQEKLGGIPSNV